jgi:N-acetylmuramoyl-L-alanine amidase
MKRLEFIIWHTTATPANMIVTREMLEQWHKGPRNLANGKVRYLGRDYPNRKALPDHRIGGVPVKLLTGRGWDRLGYSDIVHQNGIIENLTPYDGDDFVQNHEMTWGASGINSKSRHFVYAGGVAPDGRTPLDTRTPQQFQAMRNLTFVTLQYHAWTLRVGGHNQFAAKACPSFNVPDWCKRIGIPNKNIVLK